MPIRRRVFLGGDNRQTDVRVQSQVRLLQAQQTQPETSDPHPHNHGKTKIRKFDETTTQRLRSVSKLSIINLFHGGKERFIDRQMWYCRFVWLCDVLQIDFKMKPDYEVELTEKEEILSKAHKEADLLKQDKLLEYQRFLDRERVKFEETKKETLEKLSKDLAQFGFESDIKAIVEEASR